MNGRDPALARANAKARFRRGMFLLPSLFTASNIAAGLFLHHRDHQSHQRQRATLHLDWAAIAILFAIPFDALDGRIARMTNTTSDFGKELDSLADAITFGVAPSLLALIWGFHFLPDSINPQLAPACAAGRRIHLLSLSHGRRFAAGPLQHQPRCPAAQSGKAGTQIFCRHAHSRRGRYCGGHGALFLRHPGADGVVGCHSLALLVGLCGFLMVSTWRFWSGKEINFSRAPSVPIALCAVDCVLRLLRYSNVVLFRDCADLHVLRHLGARRVFVVAPPAQTARRRSRRDEQRLSRSPEP